MCDSYLTTRAHAPTLPWGRDTRYSQLNYARDLVTVRSPPSIPFDNASLSTDNLTNSSSTTPSINWATLSSKERYYNSGTSLKSYKRFDKKSSTLAPKYDMRNKSKCWPPVRLPPLVKPWTPRSNVLNKREPIGPSTRSYSAKPFGMLGTTRQWSTCTTTSIVSYKREEDRLHRPRPVRALLPGTSPTFWHDSMTYPCAMCTKNRSFKMEETTTVTASEVAVFTP